MDIEQRVRRIKLLLMDCDGVLTDGRIMLLDNGDEQKTFHTRDGHGIVLLHRAGLRSGIISGRTFNKHIDFDEVVTESGLREDEIGFIGDDVTDIPLMQRSGFAVAVADATEETKSAAHYITRLPGGFGAVRETTELILKAQGHWLELMRRYIK
jgi:3-deoxy-D-manno-octulosonate 8-phosphate phosphatase (KDO 8-P phosphatase)